MALQLQPLPAPSSAPGHAGKEGPQLARTGASQGFPRAAAPVGVSSERRGMLCSWQGLSGLCWVRRNGRGPHLEGRQEPQASSRFRTVIP